MIEAREPNGGRDEGGEVLQRLVDAFVDQSVPLGPDAATTQRLLAAIAVRQTRWLAPSAAGETSSIAAPLGTQWWMNAAIRRVASLAAAAAMIAATFGYLVYKGRRSADTANPSSDELAAASPAAPNASERTGGGQLEDAPLLSFVSDVIRDNPNLTDAARWRPVQERLTYALDRPEVIGMGVGIIGTLPWTSVGRF